MEIEIKQILDMNEVQQIILEIINAYRIEKIKLGDQYIQEVKDLAKTNIHEARILAAKNKLNSALKSISILSKVLQSHPIDKVPNPDRVGVFLSIQEIDTQTIEYLDNQLKGVI